MAVLKAEEQMGELMTASIPWMEADDRHDVLSSLQQQAGQEETVTRMGEKITEAEFREDIKRGLYG